MRIDVAEQLSLGEVGVACEKVFQRACGWCERADLARRITSRSGSLKQFGLGGTGKPVIALRDVRVFADNRGGTAFTRPRSFPRAFYFGGKRMKKVLKYGLILFAGAAARLVAVIAMTVISLWAMEIVYQMYFLLAIGLTALGIWSGFWLSDFLDKSPKIPWLAGALVYALGAAIVLAVMIIQNEIGIAKSAVSTQMFSGLGYGLRCAFRWVLWGNAPAVILNPLVQVFRRILKKTNS